MEWGSPSRCPLLLGRSIRHSYCLATFFSLLAAAATPNRAITLCSGGKLASIHALAVATHHCLPPLLYSSRAILNPFPSLPTTGRLLLPSLLPTSVPPALSS
ncbi:hypothetical protein B296_00046013 [Ensete ventricosum]|uniref:Uncharacterized protein n=1 Tax=Ensete ventricosum TaxID=4639 RepID=A0A426YDG3_ENSVE|nr:hypothetical protein B296_00046013 [Ensete ventricosum]